MPARHSSRHLIAQILDPREQGERVLGSPRERRRAVRRLAHARAQRQLDVQKQPLETAGDGQVDQHVGVARLDVPERILRMRDALQRQQRRRAVPAHRTQQLDRLIACLPAFEHERPEALDARAVTGRHRLVRWYSDAAMGEEDVAVREMAIWGEVSDDRPRCLAKRAARQ